VTFAFACRATLTEVTFSQEDTVRTSLRGFAAMDHERQREIASKGGKTAHARGAAHEWSSAEAREAGRKGGLARARQASPGKRRPTLTEVPK